MISREKLLNYFHEKDPFEDFDFHQYPFDRQGWGSDSPMFAKLISEIQPELIFEVGVWKGASTVTMATALKTLGLDTQIVCIDTWLGAQEFWGDHQDPDRYVSLRLDHGYPRVYYQFLANMMHADIAQHVVPFPTTSLIAARFMKAAGIKADLIYIDASHDAEDVFMDIQAYSELLTEKGVLFGDDFDENWPGVRRAVASFCKITGARFDVYDGRLWVMEPHPNQVNRPFIDLVEAGFDFAAPRDGSARIYPRSWNPLQNSAENDQRKADEMENTVNLRLPYIEGPQALKHITHNQSLLVLDALVQFSVISRAVDAPPATPAEGDRYVIPAAATDNWAGKGGQIAAFQNGSWAYLVPQNGWLAWIGDEQSLVVFSGGAWPLYSGGIVSGSDNVPRLGINAVASNTERLALASASSLLNHEGNDHRLKINRADSGDTASMIYQTGFQGGAETGLMGSGNFEVKVSPNGVDWHRAISADKDNGHVTLDGGLTSNSWAAAPQFSASGAAGTFRGFAMSSSGTFRFDIGIDNMAEAGGNSGSNLYVNRFADDGGYLGTSFSIERSTGTVSLNGGVAQSSANLAAPSFNVSSLPSASARGAGALVYVPDAAGSAVLAFSNGTNWLRSDNLAVVS